jgi:hypothetical protein
MFLLAGKGIASWKEPRESSCQTDAEMLAQHRRILFFVRQHVLLPTAPPPTVVVMKRISLSVTRPSGVAREQMCEY